MNGSFDPAPKNATSPIAIARLYPGGCSCVRSNPNTTSQSPASKSDRPLIQTYDSTVTGWSRNKATSTSIAPFACCQSRLATRRRSRMYSEAAVRTCRPQLTAWCSHGLGTSACDANNVNIVTGRYGPLGFGSDR